MRHSLRLVTHAEYRHGGWGAARIAALRRLLYE